jgi:hypothetical protein
MCQVKENFVVIVRYSLSFSVSVWFRFVVQVENFILRLEVSVLTATRKLETGSFVHSFVKYLTVLLNFSFFFHWPERDWIFLNNCTNSVVMHICVLRHHAAARSLVSVSCPPTLPFPACR